jgi:hypothetical protein
MTCQPHQAAGPFLPDVDAASHRLSFSNTAMIRAWASPSKSDTPRGDPALPRLNVPDLVFFGSFVTAASWDLPVQIDDDSTGDP